MSTSPDTVIVGAGIVGSSAAYALARAGQRVLLLDGDQPGTATAAGAGIIQSLSGNEKPPALQALLFAGAEEYERLVPLLAEDGIADTTYRTPGAMLTVSDDESAARLQALLAVWQAAGWSGRPGAGGLELLGPDEVVARCPVARPAPAAILMGGAGRVDGRRLRAGLQLAFERRGGHILRSEATSVSRAGVEAGGEMLRSAHILMATGAWGNGILPEGGAGLVPMRPRRGEILHLQVQLPTGSATAGPEHWPSVTRLDFPHYLVGFPGDRAVVGGTRAEVGYDARVTAGGLAELLAAQATLAPGLGTASFLEARVGLRPVAADELPVVGAAGSLPGVVVGNGLGHSGLHMGPAVGRHLARLLTGERGGVLPFESAVDWDAFSPDRDVHAAPSPVPASERQPAT